MNNLLSSLLEETRSYGNHFRKYLYIVEKTYQTLNERFEDCDMGSFPAEWESLDVISEEMGNTLKVARSEEEMLKFSGCVYSFRFLEMITRNLNLFRAELNHSPPFKTYREFMTRVGEEFRFLTSLLIKNFIHILGKGLEFPVYVLCGVGTSWDQDDIDIGIIVEDNGDRKGFDSLISRLSHQMMKYASRLHFHLSEHVGTSGYSATISEYRELLEKEISDFVIISEMLGAYPIAGDTDLFERFRREITDRYYAGERENIYHEGYMRGLMGEVRSLLSVMPGREVINPKEDGLRIIKGLINAKRTIFSVKETNPWAIIRELTERDAGRKEGYTTLKDALALFECFRYLFQLFSVQEESINLAEKGTRDNLEFVAGIMNFAPFGTVSSGDRFLTHYHETLEKIKGVAETFFHDLTSHLERVSVFSRMTMGHKHTLLPPFRKVENPAVSFVKNILFFKGTTFWDDILEALSSPDSTFFDRMHDGLLELGKKREILIYRLVSGMTYDLENLLNVLTILGEVGKRKKKTWLFEEFNENFLKSLSLIPLLERSLLQLFYRSPLLVHRYLSLLPFDIMKSLIRLETLDEMELPGYENIKDSFKELCRAHCYGSHYFKRFFFRIVQRHPEFLPDLYSYERLKERARGFLAEAMETDEFDKKRFHLENYFDIGFFNVGMKTIRGGPFEEINREFTSFSDRYIRTLFAISHEEVEKRRGITIPRDDNFSIYVAGGHAREQAFDEDYDLIALIHEKSRELYPCYSDIMMVMNREISRQGLLPHYRSAQSFGKYVVFISEMEEYFSAKKEYDFIEKSQLVGSKQVVGSDRFERMLMERIILPFIFDPSAAESYTASMLSEIQARKDACEQGIIHPDNVKEAPGGLRDIETIIFICKVRFRIREPANLHIFDILSQRDPGHHREFETLKDGTKLLKNMRDLLRLVSGADDIISQESTEQISEILWIEDSFFRDHGQRLIDIFKTWQERIEEAVNRLIKELLN